MCICVCVCVCARVHAYAWVRLLFGCVCMHACVGESLSVCMYVCMRACMGESVRVGLSVSEPVCRCKTVRGKTVRRVCGVYEHPLHVSLHR